MSKITVMIVDDVAATREDIKRLLYFEEDIVIVGEAKDGDEAVEMVQAIKPEVILMDINMPRMDGIRASEIITEMNPDSSIVIISIQSEKEYLRKAMTAGARDYLVKPFSSEELAETIRRVGNFTKKRHLNLVGGKNSSTIQIRNQGKIISFFSTKGGIGKTTISCNLAVSLAQSTRTKLALVDMDLQGGDIPVFMNIPAKGGLDEIVQEEDYSDPSLLETYLNLHMSGIKILTAPSSPENAELITAAHVEGIIKSLRDIYDYVLLDTSSSLNDITLSCLELSDQILLIADQDLPTLRHAKVNLELLEKLGLSEKTKFILNRFRKDAIKTNELEKHINCKLWYTLPLDIATVTTSINKGQPFVLSKPSAEISKEINKMALLLNDSCTMKIDKNEPSPQQPTSIIGKIINCMG